MLICRVCSKPESHIRKCSFSRCPRNPWLRWWCRETEDIRTTGGKAMSTPAEKWAARQRRLREEQITITFTEDEFNDAMCYAFDKADAGDCERDLSDPGAVLDYYQCIRKELLSRLRARQ